MRLATRVLLVCATLVSSAGIGRRALAGDTEPPAPVTPFIDSGNDLPDLDARAREAAREARKAPDAQVGRGRWYGWQLLAADLGTTTCFVGLQSGICVVGYWGAGIGIHLAHGRPGLAGVSIGLRTGLPALGAGIGLAIANCPARQASPRTTVTTEVDGGTVTYTTGGDWDFCGLGEAAIGVLVGAVIASAVDAAIAYERVAPETPAAPVARRPRLIEPQLAVKHDGFTLGLGAAF